MKSHKKLFENLIADPNIYDNLDTTDDFETIVDGCTAIGIGFRGHTGTGGHARASLVFLFDSKGRMTEIRVGVKRAGVWETIDSDVFPNLTDPTLLDALHALGKKPRRGKS